MPCPRLPLKVCPRLLVKQEAVVTPYLNLLVNASPVNLKPRNWRLEINLGQRSVTRGRFRPSSLSTTCHFFLSGHDGLSFPVEIYSHGRLSRSSLMTFSSVGMLVYELFMLFSSPTNSSSYQLLLHFFGQHSYTLMTSLRLLPAHFWTFSLTLSELLSGSFDLDRLDFFFTL